MAKQELRASVAALMEEKGKLEKDVIIFTDKRNSLAEELSKMRGKQFSHREAKETLGNRDTNKAAKLALDKLITELQVSIEAKQKEIDSVGLDLEMASGKLRNMLSSIKELENA